ncbi:unnamed protein product [Clavelina lepadiformis]|uniref:Nidogen-1 n=2 Tax=Clavelina lepadiformis TaxID=159417 RepID=A0ABP0FL14_CLALP
MKLSACLALGLLGVVQAITVNDLYPFNPQHDARLPIGDSAISHKISLAVPAKFYDTEYDYLWISTDGFISFEPDFSDVKESDFPFREALLAPYMAHLDTTHTGEVFYSENSDLEVLFRATAEIRSAFPVAAADFEGESAFIVTWYNVQGYSIDDELASFTFQSVLVSNGRDSYAIFLYPKGRMGMMANNLKQKTAMFQARAGFNQGNSLYLEMYPVESLIDHRNTDRNGEWIFQVGGEGVKRQRDVISPERSHHSKRQALLNVQEVDLGIGDAEDPEQQFDFCSHDEEACPAANSECVNHDQGYCCRCLTDYYGNGKICVDINIPIQVNGNVSGTVDVRDTDGHVSRQTIRNAAFHSFVQTDSGRSFEAVSGVQNVLGLALQPIEAVGDVIGWLFALPTTPAVNGFQYTGGSFQRRVSIKFKNEDFRFDMRQRFLGVKDPNADGVKVVIGHTNFVGLLPAIPANATVKMEPYHEDFVKQGQGQITSSATRTYTVDGMEHSYDIQQTIMFSECRESLQSVPDTLRMDVSGTFFKYHAEDDVVRYAMNVAVSAPEASNIPFSPCQVGNHGCDENARCDPLEGEDYSCICNSGFAGNGRTCEDVDECVSNRCPANSVCYNTVGSYQCECDEGFEMNVETGECEESEVTPVVSDAPCTVNPCGAARCVEVGTSYRCECPEGYDYEDGACEDIDECAENRHNCALNARCENIVGSFVCMCNPGFQGDGVTCAEITCPGNQVFSTCAGCVTNCEDRGRPQICTLQCRMECTCPPQTFKNGDMCVTADQCPESGGEEEKENIRCYVGMKMTTSVGQGQDNLVLTSCDPGSSCLEMTATTEQTFGSAKFTADLTMGQCIPSSVCDAMTCAQLERSIPPEAGLTRLTRCTTRCCSEDSCNKPAESETQTPSETNCQREYADAATYLRNHPNIQDGPDFPTCDQDGTYASKQCNEFTDVCWCVDTTDGVMVEGTLTDPDEGYLLDCSLPENQPLTQCQRRYKEIEAIHKASQGRLQDGPIYPSCAEDGSFSPRQCNGFVNVCWCVDPQTGEVDHSTRTDMDLGHTLVCPGDDNNVPADIKLTQCQQERDRAQAAENTARGPVLVPICTAAGAFEPKQFHPAGYFICVDFNGVEVSRHTSEPTCKTTCQLQEYYARTDNVFGGTNKFVPQCDENGDFSRVQCDQTTRSCFCADKNGEEVGGTRTSAENPDDVNEEILECDRYDAPPVQETAPSVIFAQSLSLNSVNLPITSNSVPLRVFSRSGQTVVGVAYDCDDRNLYWSDVSGRVIYMAPVSNLNSRSVFARTGLRSPEGVAVDFISGNIYWTDSGRDRIEVAKKDGTNRMVLISTGLHNPRGIAVDPFGGKLYWSDWYRSDPKIMWSNLDGSDARVFLSEGIVLPNDVTIDHNYRRLCFIDGGTRKVECTNLDGSQRSVVYDFSVGMSRLHSPFGLAVDGRTIYYTDRRGNRLYAVNTANNDVVSVGGPLGSHGPMYGLDIIHSQCRIGYNGCRNNGGCSHLCLPVPNGRSCKCPPGAENCVEQ